MVTIPLRVSEQLAGRIIPLQDRLTEIIELGLRQIEAEANVSAEANRVVNKLQVLAALSATGLVTLPRLTTPSRNRVRHTPIKSGGLPVSQMIIQERGPQ